MPNKPNKFSFYDVKNIPESLMNFDFIKEIDYDVVSKSVTLTYRSGTILPLGSVDPGPTNSLTGASLNANGELVFSVSNGTSINAGRVVADYYYEDDYISGTGFLSSERGVYKPLVSGSPDLTVTEGDSAVEVSATFPGSFDISVLDETRIYNNYTWLVEASASAESSYTINTWHTRKLNTSRINNLNISLSSSSFVLTRGTYYISGYARSYRGGRTKIALRDIINNRTIIDSVGAANFSATVSSSVKNVISGYVFIEDDTTVALQQMLSEFVTGSVLGANPTGTQLASVAKTHSELNIWKLSEEILPPTVLPEEAIDPLIAALQRNYYLNVANSMTASTGDFGANLTGSQKWHGLVNGPDGKIYGIPRHSQTSILVIDSNSDTVSLSNLGANLTGIDKWVGGVLGSDGKIYGIPFTSADILIIDTASGIASRDSMGASLTGSGKWAGGVLAPNGLIYCIPFSATDILIINPAAGTATRSNMGTNLSGSNKWAGGVLGPDGKIYGIPYDSTDILIIDPSTNIASRVTLGVDLSGTSKWQGGVLGLDGKIYGIPMSSSNILVIDPPSMTATHTTFGLGLSGTGKWFGGVLGSDGKIYGIPANSSNILTIDTIAGTASLGTLGADLSNNSKYAGGVLSLNGSIYTAPFNNAIILKITPTIPTSMPGNVTLSPYLNKY